MAVTKVLARDWKIEILTKGSIPVLSATDYTPSADAEWSGIGGITSLTFGSDSTEADTTSFDEAGRESHLIVKRGNTVTIDGKYLEDQLTGERDAGQQAVEIAADQIGPTAMRYYRLTSPGGTERVFLASTKLAELGGGTDDPTSWGAECKCSGLICKKIKSVIPSVITSFTTPANISVPNGTDKSNINLPTTLVANLNTTGTAVVPVTYDCTSYDGSVAADYKFTGTLGVLPVNVTNTSNIQAPDITITVQP